MGIRKKEARSQETFPTSSPFLKFNLGEEGRRTGARRLAPLLRFHLGKKGKEARS